jgi:hypothetical protein
VHTAPPATARDDTAAVPTITAKTKNLFIAFLPFSQVHDGELAFRPLFIVRRPLPVFAKKSFGRFMLSNIWLDRRALRLLGQVSLASSPTPGASDVYGLRWNLPLLSM